MKKWMKIENRLPYEIEPVLVYAKNEYGGYTKKIAIRDEQFWFNWETHKRLPHIPTHWQPLPESPE